MSKHRTIYAASPAGTHPSYASSGVHAGACDECGVEITYTANINGTYRYHDGPVGVRSEQVDLCDVCWLEIEGEALE